MTTLRLLAILFVALQAVTHDVGAFVSPARIVSPTSSLGQTASRDATRREHAFSFMMTSDDKLSDDGVVELVDEDTEGAAPPATRSVAPFLSQGEILEESLNPDLSDPKQTRVIIYIILSLLPVLFLIPLMLGSRDLIPMDAFPPVVL